MGVSGQLHAPTALPPGKEPLYPLDRGQCGPQSRSGRGGDEKNLIIIIIIIIIMMKRRINNSSSINRTDNDRLQTSVQVRHRMSTVRIGMKSEMPQAYSF
jgi:hypothetical protein